jgi:hypothetical protein
VSISADTPLAREAIAAVARSHEQYCACTICLAAAGDQGALCEVLAAVDELAEADLAVRNRTPAESNQRR